MKKEITTIRLVLLAGLSLLAVAAADRYAVGSKERPDAGRMRAAAELADRWMDNVIAEKKNVGCVNPEFASVPRGGLLGDEYSGITTTLGSLEAKELSLNPEFAALVVRILDDAGVDSTSVVGVTLSGSFPAVSISTLAALRTVGARVVLTSSLGASTYGANQPEALWCDYERWLRNAGMPYASSYVTPGGESDTGGSFDEEGMNHINTAAVRNGITMSKPRTLDEGIDARVRLLSDARINLLINIGGSQTSLGGCVHASTIPPGFQRRLTGCSDSSRGVLVRMNERGIPVLHLLNIRSLAARYGVGDKALASSNPYGGIYEERSVNRTAAAALLLCLVAAFAAGGRNVRTAAGAVFRSQEK